MIQNKPCLGNFNSQSYKCIECDDGHVCRLVGARRAEMAKQQRPHKLYGRKIAPWNPGKEITR